MCDKSVDTHPPTTKYIPQCHKTQEMYNKPVHSCFFVFDSIPDQYEAQEICDIVVSLYHFLIVHCPDKYITQKMFDEALDDCLAALKLFSDWFVKSKMIKKLYTGMYAGDGLLFLMKILMISHFVVLKWIFLV